MVNVNSAKAPYLYAGRKCQNWNHTATHRPFLVDQTLADGLLRCNHQVLPSTKSPPEHLTLSRQGHLLFRLGTKDQAEDRKYCLCSSDAWQNLYADLKAPKPSIG